MINELLMRYPALTQCAEQLEQAKTMLIQCYQNAGKLLLCGNGGSCADCDHIVGELMKGFLKKRPLNDAQKNQMRLHCDSLDEDMLQKLQCGLPAISLPLPSVKYPVGITRIYVPLAITGSTVFNAACCMPM